MNGSKSVKLHKKHQCCSCEVLFEVYKMCNLQKQKLTDQFTFEEEGKKSLNFSLIALLSAHELCFVNGNCSPIDHSRVMNIRQFVIFNDL